MRRALFYFERAVSISVQTVIGSRWWVVYLSNHNKKCACKAVSILHSVFAGHNPPAPFLRQQSVFDKSRMHHQVYEILHFRRVFSGPFNLQGYV